MKRKKEGLNRLRAWQKNRGEKQSKEAKTLAFRRILGLGVISRFLEVEETSPLLCNLVFSLKPFCCLWKVLPCNGGVKSIVGKFCWVLDVNTYHIYLKLFLCVRCFYPCLIIACLWLDHPFVCAVRSFNFGKCIASLDLDRTGLGYRIIWTQSAVI